MVQSLKAVLEFNCNFKIQVGYSFVLFRTIKMYAWMQLACRSHLGWLILGPLK